MFFSLLLLVFQRFNFKTVKVWFWAKLNLDILSTSACEWHLLRLIKRNVHVDPFENPTENYLKKR